MLFPYQYVPHSLEKMQEYMDYIFYEVWCKASGRDYDIETLFSRHDELKEIIIAFHYSDDKGPVFFLTGIQEIFLLFQGLNAAEIRQMQNWYCANNNIESLCHNDPACIPATYDDIKSFNPKLGEVLKAFFTQLYSENFLSLKALSAKIGSVGKHYKEFVSVNRGGKCPFCGMSDIEGEYSHVREAYDHYLPKSKYPFSSINFHNLAPACHKCNSGYKTTKDPLHDRHGKRRKAFYAYQTAPYQLEINLQIHSQNMDDIKPQEISISFGPSYLADELQTWDDLYGISERYRDKCCSTEAKYWIDQIFECSEVTSPADFLKIRLESARRHPFDDTNFLRKPFLEACDQLHIFDK